MSHERMPPIETDKKAVQSLPDEELSALINETKTSLLREKRQLSEWQRQLKNHEHQSGWDVEGGVAHALGSVAKLGYEYEMLLIEQQRREALKNNPN